MKVGEHDQIGLMIVIFSIVIVGVITDDSSQGFGYREWPRPVMFV